MTAVDIKNLTASELTARGSAQVPMAASLSVLHWPGLTVARLHGDLDIVTAPALRESLRGILGPGMRLLTVDLSGVGFCDVAGLAMLIGTQRHARAHGIMVQLANLPRHVARLLRSTGLDDNFAVCATLADALAPRREPPAAA
jgi:anti-anti-sigma factor